MTFSRHAPRKRFGQHWLKDGPVLEHILLAADIKTGDRVLEIGPGRGSLTEKLLKSLDYPLAAPSANIYTQISPVSKKDVKDEF